jgi:predicted esterase
MWLAVPVVIHAFCIALSWMLKHGAAFQCTIQMSSLLPEVTFVTQKADIPCTLIKGEGDTGGVLCQAGYCSSGVQSGI